MKFFVEVGQKALYASVLETVGRLLGDVEKRYDRTLFPTRDGRRVVGHT
jgi:hypothetical protein